MLNFALLCARQSVGKVANNVSQERAIGDASGHPARRPATTTSRITPSLKLP